MEFDSHPNCRTVRSLTMRAHQIVILLVLTYFSIGVMSKKVAGLVVFRRVNGNVEYLMLKPNSRKKEWSPPKGILAFFYLFFILLRLEFSPAKGKKPI